MKENLWDGFVPASEHPRIYDPERGYIVSANNLITTENCKHGISHAFSFTHRFIRLNQMFEERIRQKGKLDIQDMKDAQLDTIDIQAQLSIEYIIKNVEKGLDSALNIIYKKEQEKTLMAPNVLDFEPHMALFVEDKNPLVFYEKIATFALHNLAKTDFLLLNCMKISLKKPLTFAQI